MAVRIEAPFKRAVALAKVASALVEVGDADKARRVAEKAARTAEQIEIPRERAMDLAKVASALVGAGLTEKALALVERIEAPRERAWDLAKVASSLVEVGAIDEALKIVSAMNDPVSRSRALSLVIKALVRKGSSDDAVEVMRVEIAWGRGMAQRQEAAEYCAALAAVCVDSADFLADSADAEPAERDRWLSLACSGIAHSWLYGASVWDNFDELVRVAPELAVQLVDERILAEPEGGTPPESDPDLGPEGPGGHTGAYR